MLRSSRLDAKSCILTERGVKKLQSLRLDVKGILTKRGLKKSSFGARGLMDKVVFRLRGVSKVMLRSLMHDVKGCILTERGVKKSCSGA